MPNQHLRLLEARERAAAIVAGIQIEAGKILARPRLELAGIRIGCAYEYESLTHGFRRAMSTRRRRFPKSTKGMMASRTAALAAAAGQESTPANKGPTTDPKRPTATAAPTPVAAYCLSIVQRCQRKQDQLCAHDEHTGKRACQYGNDEYLVD